MHRAPAGVTCTRGRLAGIVPGLNVVKVSVADARVEHEVTLMDFTKWPDRTEAEMLARLLSSVPVERLQVVQAAFIATPESLTFILSGVTFG